MAIRRPLYWDAGLVGLREMGDNERDVLVYNIQVALAEHLNSAGTPAGQIFGGTGGVKLVTITDTRHNAVEKDVSDTTFSGFPTPAVGTSTNPFDISQYRDATANPLNSSDVNSYLRWSGSLNDFNISYMDNNSADHIDTFLSDAVDNIVNVNEVGSYRITTGAAPTNGGTGTWTNKGTVFTDTISSDTTGIGAAVGGFTSTVYTLWLKTSGVSPGFGSSPSPVTFDIGIQGFREIASAYTDSGFFGKNGPVVQNLLLPGLLQRIQANGELNYNFNGTGNDRGTIVETFLPGTTGTQAITDGSAADPNAYIKRGTPTGTPTTTIFNFRIAIPTI